MTDPGTFSNTSFGSFRFGFPTSDLLHGLRLSRSPALLRPFAERCLVVLGRTHLSTFAPDFGQVCRNGLICLLLHNLTAKYYASYLCGCQCHRGAGMRVGGRPRSSC